MLLEPRTSQRSSLYSGSVRENMLIPSSRQNPPRMHTARAGQDPRVCMSLHITPLDFAESSRESIPARPWL